MHGYIIIVLIGISLKMDSENLHELIDHLNVLFFEVSYPLPIFHGSGGLLVIGICMEYLF